MKIIFQLLSYIYGAGVGLRNALYDHNIFSSHPFNVPVISVGNITLGGTGKTPVVEMLLRFLANDIRKLAVVTRGYRRKTKGLVVVSDGNGNIASVEQGGDEAMQIARKFPGVVVIADEKRARGCSYAIDTCHADVIILDDGYQHRSCKRDLDIVLLDAAQPVWNHRLFPAGRLREPLENLLRADVILLTKCKPNRHYQQFAQSISEYASVPVITTAFTPTKLYALRESDALAIELVKGETVFSFCGVGSPVSFKDTIQSLDATIVGMIEFRDHHRYTTIDAYRIIDEFKKSGARFLFTTEKDAMRLGPLQELFANVPLFYPVMEADLLQNQEEFFQLLERRILHKKKSLIRKGES